MTQACPSRYPCRCKTLGILRDARWQTDRWKLEETNLHWERSKQATPGFGAPDCSASTKTVTLVAITPELCRRASKALVSIRDDRLFKTTS